MATINKKRICNKHGFYNGVEFDSCPLCKKTNDKLYNTFLRKEDRAKIYNSKRWKQVRELALVRDCMMCMPCKSNGIDTIAEEVHHIQYLEHRPDLAYDLDNLISICSKCHMNIHYKNKT